MFTIRPRVYYSSTWGVITTDQTAYQETSIIQKNFYRNNFGTISDSFDRKGDETSRRDL